jgi:aryl-alcohol dehydrogenase-like predicted oxidoreductase
MSTRLALGTAQFGMAYGIANRTGQITLQAARAMLETAVAAGIDTVDTAVAYGSSEHCLGEVGTCGLRVVTKLPSLPADTQDAAAWVLSEMAASLKRLGLKRVHGVLLHRPADLLGASGQALLVGLMTARDNGLTSKIGVSVYAPDELGPLMALYPFDLVQAPLNLIDRRLLSSGWLERLAVCGVEVHTRSAFLQGLLLMPHAEQMHRFPRWADLWARLDSHRRAAGGDLLSCCLAYSMSQLGVDRVVIGADSPGQLQAIVAAAAAGAVTDWPDVACDDEALIDPRHWSAA